MTTASRLHVRPMLRSWSPALALGTVAVLCLPVPFFAMFSGFRDYDDEGYLLLSLRQYAEGGILYDQLFSQYGPAYFQVVTGLFNVLGLDFAHTAGRAAVLILWTAVALLCGIGSYRLTGNLPAALAALLLVVQALVPMRNEPLHPGGILSLILSALVLAGTYLRAVARPAVAAVIGVLLGTAVLMKVNIGLFALVSTVFALLATARLGPTWRLVRLPAALAVVLVPPSVMGALALAGAPGARAYLGVVVSAALAVVLVQFRRPARTAGGLHDLAVAGVAAVLTVAGSLAGELARGSSVEGLWRGIVVDPQRFPLLYYLPLRVPLAEVVASLAVLVLAFCVAAAHRGRIGHRAVTTLGGAGQLAAGGFIWLVAAGVGPFSPIAALPLLWVPLAAPSGETDPDREAGRALLVSIALLQALHAYPVAGSQVAWATFLFIPVGAVAIADGWRVISTALGTRFGHRRAAASAVLAALMLAFAGKAVYDTGRLVRAAYDVGVPLGLPGAESIRVPPAQAALYRYLTANLAARCRTLVSLPGLNSLYLFSRLSPPTMLNATSWPTLLTRAQQAAVAERLAGHEGPVCAVLWGEPDDSDAPLVRYLAQDFLPVFTVGEYHFLIRRPRAGRDGLSS